MNKAPGLAITRAPARERSDRHKERERERMQKQKSALLQAQT